MMRLLVKTHLIVLSIFLLGGCASNPVSGKKNFVLMSEQQEIALGKQNHGQILQQYGVYDSPKLQKLVNSIGNDLARNSHRSHLNYTFTLLDSPDVNAFALPGGYIYITRGIISYMNSEEELAGVLGHELGHVTARHGVQQQSANQVSSLLTVLATAYTGSSSVGELSNYLGNALVSGYGRNHELQADELGAEYITRAGYDPESMLNVIGILKDQEQFNLAKAGKKKASSYHGLFSTHPNNDQRLKQVIQAANRLKGHVPSKLPNKNQFIQLSDHMVYGDNETQGIVRKQSFYHKDLDLRLLFPEKWTLSNQHDRLLAMGPNKQHIIQFMMGDSKGTDPKTLLTQKFEQLTNGKQLSPSVYTGTAPINTPWGEKPARVAAVKHKDMTFVLLGTGQTNISKNDFLNTVKSLRSLTSEEKTLASSKQIRVIKARANDSYATLAKHSSLTEYAEEQLRLLNGDYPTGEPVAGQLIKIVQ